MRQFCFNGFRLDTVCRQLYAPDGQVVPLTAKALDTLLVLIENRPAVVSRDTLMAQVWPGRVVEENNLNQAVSALRKAFGTDAHDHRYIVTVPGKGYAFAAEVYAEDRRAVGDARHSRRADDRVDAANPPVDKKMWRLPALGLVLLGSLALWVRSHFG